MPRDVPRSPPREPYLRSWSVRHARARETPPRDPLGPKPGMSFPVSILPRGPGPGLQLRMPGRELASRPRWRRVTWSMWTSDTGRWLGVWGRIPADDTNLAMTISLRCRAIRPGPECSGPGSGPGATMGSSALVLSVCVRPWLCNKLEVLLRIIVQLT